MGRRMIIPKSRPQATREQVIAYACQVTSEEEVKAAIGDDGVLLVAVRGYYKKTMGDPSRNDRNLYDDALFILTPDKMRSYNWNVDPSKFRKGIASLLAGVYKLVKWRHRGKYAALQIVQDKVVRDQLAGIDTGRHGINLHYGGDSDTWSEGCQTAPQAQYWQIQGHTYELMDRNKLKVVTYVLAEA